MRKINEYNYKKNELKKEILIEEEIIIINKK